MERCGMSHISFGQKMVNSKGHFLVLVKTQKWFFFTEDHSLIEVHLKKPERSSSRETEIILEYFRDWFSSLSEDDFSQKLSESTQVVVPLHPPPPKQRKRKRVVVRQVVVVEETDVVNEREAQVFVFAVWVYFVILIPMVLALYICVVALENSYEELRIRYETLKELMRERQRNATSVPFEMWH